MIKNNYQSRPNTFRNKEKYLTIAQVAAKLFYSKDAVRKLISQRTLEAFRNNGRWWILAKSVETFEQVLIDRNSRRRKKKTRRKR